MRTISLRSAQLSYYQTLQKERDAIINNEKKLAREDKDTKAPSNKPERTPVTPPLVLKPRRALFLTIAYLFLKQPQGSTLSMVSLTPYLLPPEFTTITNQTTSYYTKMVDSYQKRIKKIGVISLTSSSTSVVKNVFPTFPSPVATHSKWLKTFENDHGPTPYVVSLIECLLKVSERALMKTRIRASERSEQVKRASHN